MPVTKVMPSSNYSQGFDYFYENFQNFQHLFSQGIFTDKLVITNFKQQLRFGSAYISYIHLCNF